MINGTLVRARDVLSLDPVELWSTFDHPNLFITVVFDDGEINTTGRELIFSQFFWQYHREYPLTPLEIKHHLPAKRIGKKSTIELIKHGLWSTFDAYNGEVPIMQLCQMAYGMTNEFYNTMIRKTGRYITSLSANDFVDVLNHPKVKAANENAKPTFGSIQETYKKITEALKTEGEFVGNRLGETTKSNLVNNNQTMHVVGPRGFVTDIDSTIIPKAIMTGYAQGLTSIIDHAAESRSCSKALFFAKNPLADVEYLNRQFQLMMHAIRHLWKGDCGTTTTLPITLSSKRDLETHEGIYYLVEGGLTPIGVEDTHLLGKELQIRSPLYCRCLPKQGVCSTCFGMLSDQIPPDTNLGHLVIIELCAGISQNTLSQKHLDNITSISGFVIPEGDEPYIKLGDKDNHINLSKRLIGRKIKMIIPADGAFNLTEINHVSVLQNVPITRISELTTVCLEIHDPVTKDTWWYDVLVSDGSKRSSLTFSFLAYIKRKGWTVNETGAYEVDVTDWDFNKPVFELPLRNVNTMEFMAEVAGIIKFKNLKRRRSTRAKEFAMNPYEAAAQATQLHDIVNKRFEYHFSLCQTVLACCLVVDAKAGNYSLPGPDDTREFAPFKEVMEGRSMSQSYAFQGQAARILDIDSFNNKRRPSHTMDSIFVPD